MLKIGGKISRLRLKKKMSQSELAEKAGVSFQAVSNWERDETLPDTDRLPAIAGALGIGVGALFGEQNYEMPYWETHGRVFAEERMYTFVKTAATARGLCQTLMALPFAREKHEGQTRKHLEGEEIVPFINHPLTMACHALAMDIRDDNVLAAILLHDVVEDCNDVEPEDLPVNDTVRDTVVRMTHTWPKGGDTPEGMRKYYDRILESPAASLVKIIDRCNNLSMMPTGFTHEKMASYIVETEKYVFPVMKHLKETAPEYSNALFLLKYQMVSMMESLKRLLG